MLWPPIPLGQRPRGALHNSAGAFDPISELAGAAGFLAASANLPGNSNLARRLLSILTSIAGSSITITSEKHTITTLA